MCGGWAPIRNALETVASIAGNYELPGSSLLTDNLVSKGSQAQLSSPLGELAQIGSGVAGAGGLGAGLQSAGGAAESSLAKSAIQSLNQFLPDTGLSSLLGGTATPGNQLNAIDSGINSAPASQAVAQGASNAATPSTGALASSGTIGSTGGGAPLGGGVDLTNAGQAITTPSASGLGGSNLTQGTNNLINNFAQEQAASTPVTDALSPQVIQASNAATPGGVDTSLNQPSFLQNLTGSTTPIAQSGGNVGTTGNLLGGNGGASAINGLLKGGLGYLLNQPNTKGAGAITNATNAAQANFAPYLQAGQAAESQISNLLGNNGTVNQQAAQQQFQNTPGYQFALNQGLGAVNAQAALGGNPLSGNTYEALNNYAQGTADQTYNNYVQNLSNQASGGLTAAGGSGTAGLAGASALSQLDQNNASAKNTAIGTALGGLFPSGQSIQQLLAGLNNNPQSGGGNNNGILQYLSNLI